MSAERVRELVGRLGASVNALSAVGAALGARATGVEPPPSIRERLDEVLEVLGVRQAIGTLAAVDLRSLIGDIHLGLLSGVQRVAGAHTQGWAPGEGAVLQAAGDVSAAFPSLLRRMVPQLEGLGARLEGAGGRFLDVGVGVGALSMEMTRTWPRLRVVGIDVWAPALAIARSHVEGAGLRERIELREQGVEDLADAQAFDLAWIPSAFIPAPVLPQGLRRVQRALRPGGWVLFAALTGGGDALSASLARLRTAEWGGQAWKPEEAAALLTEAGFADVRVLPGPPSAVLVLTAGHVR